MLALGEDKVREMIKTIGLFRTKAKNVILLSERLVKDFGGKVPRTREELETLPGVGRKTANVVMNTAFGDPTIAVDTHHLPHFEPHSPRAGKDGARSRIGPGEDHPARNTCTMRIIG